MTNEERLHYLAGELISVTALLRAIIETHPDREMLRLLFDRNIQAARATTEATQVPEPYLDGLLDKADSLWYDL